MIPVRCDEEHRYFIGTPGTNVPGVTEILTGLHLVDYSNVDVWYRDRGTAIHAAIQYHLEGDLALEHVDDRIMGFVESGIRFIEEARLIRSQIERVVASEVYQYAGRADYIGPAFGEPTVIDWKSGALHDVVGLQTAAYDMADPLMVAGQPKPRARMGVQLMEDGSRAKKRDYLDRNDGRRFLAAADLYRRFIFKRTTA